MSSQSELFIPPNSSTSAVASHPLEILLHCAASTSLTSSPFAPMSRLRSDSQDKTLCRLSDQLFLDEKGSMPPSPPNSTFQLLGERVLQGSSLSRPQLDSASNILEADEVDPFARVSQSIVDLVYDVMPDLSSRLSRGKMREASELQHRIANILRHQLSTEENGTSDCKMRPSDSAETPDYLSSSLQDAELRPALATLSQRPELLMPHRATFAEELMHEQQGVRHQSYENPSALRRHHQWWGTQSSPKGGKVGIPSNYPEYAALDDGQAGAPFSFSLGNEGLNNTLADLVLQEFLRSQGGSLSPPEEPDNTSPKSTTTLAFSVEDSLPFSAPYWSRGYAVSPSQSASSGRHDRVQVPTSSSEPIMGVPMRNLKESTDMRSPLIARDLRPGVCRRNFESVPLVVSSDPTVGANRHYVSSRVGPRCPRSTGISDGPSVLTRSTLGGDRLQGRSSHEMTHSQAMLAMAAAARKSTSSYNDDHDRMVYISWIPKQSRAYTTVDRRRMELELKKKLREDLQLEGVTKVLLFPPKGAHCKLIFDKRSSAENFMTKYGGDDGSDQSEMWKNDICRAFGIVVNERFSKTVVKIEWSQR
eukprot:Gregarina_sp_Poly_1__11330@NODE_94_length_14661_cov_203_748664_g81_i0_p2_GENE_NODE_94_length_14661_cov_203_748664_g81_i0NODE_94_length_14661_cov_203_748664_g81_i0_p2_ORF_typecomplete_len590_score70_69kleA_kleC/PF17383_2/67kleA_kleC/PF17383_2/21_NODE_94_length_14661_cov_203_748664_g81_i01211513884